jgi:hypothetical protein
MPCQAHKKRQRPKILVSVFLPERLPASPLPGLPRGCRSAVFPEFHLNTVLLPESFNQIAPSAPAQTGLSRIHHMENYSIVIQLSIRFEYYFPPCTAYEPLPAKPISLIQ